MKKETFHLTIRFLVGLAASLLICAGMIMTEKLGSNKPLIQQASGLKGTETVMTVDGEVRLMGAYIVKCTGVDKNADGSIAAIHCTADLETGNGNPADGRKVKGTIHWVSAAHCVDAEVRLYDKLFTEANMNGIPEGSDYKDYLNPESVTVRTGCKLEESLKDAKPGEKFQFVRTGFFTPDSKNPGVYNRVVTLRDSFKPAK